MINEPIEKMGPEYEQIVDKVQMTFVFIKICILKITEISFFIYQISINPVTY